MMWQLAEGALYDVTGVWKWPFYVVQLAGVHLTLRAAGFLDFLELAGIRQLQPRTREVVFRSDGPFGLVRHPIYLGWMLMTFATPAMTLNRLIFAAITTGYLIVAIPWEERSLVSAFGERYRAYQSVVKWRLIPGIW
jgi:protein-S-isoprenylcysteine O-methyltransferase Ste14